MRNGRCQCDKNHAVLFFYFFLVDIRKMKRRQKIPTDVAKKLLNCFNTRDTKIIPQSHGEFNVTQYLQEYPQDFIIVGSILREEPGPHKDFDLLTTLPIASAVARVQRCVDSHVVQMSGVRRASIIIGVGSAYYTIDLFHVAPGELPFALFHYTGNKAFNIRTRAHAKRQGMLLNQYGLFKITGKKLIPVNGLTCERDIFDYLGITYRLPKDRKR